MFLKMSYRCFKLIISHNCLFVDVLICSVCCFLFPDLSSLSLIIVCLLVFKIVYCCVFFPDLSSCSLMLVHNYCYLQIFLILFTIELWFFISFKCKRAFNSQEINICILSSTFHFIASFFCFIYYVLRMVKKFTILQVCEMCLFVAFVANIQLHARWTHSSLFCWHTSFNWCYKCMNQ